MTMRNRVPEVDAALPPGWDVCVSNLNDGVQPQMAIQNVYDALPPPALITTVANIVGAVYGDAFWLNTQMSWQTLSNDLQAAGFGQPASDKAAQIAFANWHGLFQRKDFNDIGAIPYQGSNPCNSPDLVCNQGAPLTKKTILDRWNSYFWNYATVGKNYVYTRGTSINFPPPIGKGPDGAKLPQASVFYSDAGFNIPPTSWVNCSTLTGKTSMPIETPPIGQGDRWVCSTEDPFIFQPPTQGHYCLVSVVQSNFFANNPQNIDPSSNWNTWNWLVCNGAAAWHNINVQSSVESTLKFYNLDSRPERFVFEAHCSKLPEGSSVSLRCPDPKLSGGLVTKSHKISRAYQTLRTEATVPGDFVGDLQVRIETPGGKVLTPDASVEVRMSWVLEHGHPLYAKTAARLGSVVEALNAQPLELSMGNFTFIG